MYAQKERCDSASWQLLSWFAVFQLQFCGSMQVVAVNTAMSSLVKTLNVFPRERTIVMRERSKRAYDVLPYFGSKRVLHSISLHDMLSMAF